jgi:signal peptidase I
MLRVFLVLLVLSFNCYSNTADKLLTDILSRYTNKNYINYNYSLETVEIKEEYKHEYITPKVYTKKFRIVSPSMAPEINTGSLVWIDNDFPFNNIKIGDVIIYKDNKPSFGTYNIVHRVIKKGNGYLICKGDRNSSPDSTKVTINNYMGKVSFVEQYASL